MNLRSVFVQYRWELECRSPTDPTSQHPGRLETTKQGRTHGIHIEDDEDPVELRLLSGNSLLVVPRVKKSRLLRPLCLMTLLRISATVLGSGAISRLV